MSAIAQWKSVQDAGGCSFCGVAERQGTFRVLVVRSTIGGQEARLCAACVTIVAKEARHD